VLLDSTQLARAGRGLTRATFAFRALHHVGRRDYLSVCIKGQARLGLGRPSRYLRQCGRRQIRF
jgi:hypothetical protein